MSIDLDRFHYDDWYPAFLRGTNDKQIAAEIIQKFLNRLMQEDAVIDCDAGYAKIADIGCGQGSALVQLLENVKPEFGYELIGIDQNKDYAEAAKLTYKDLVSGEGDEYCPVLALSYEGDVFDGNITETIKTKYFDIAVMSHVMYHAADKEQVRTTLKDITNNVIRPKGIAILLHDFWEEKTFEDLNQRFGGLQDTTVERDAAVGIINDVTEVIKEVCSKEKIPYISMDYYSKIHFSDQLVKNGNLLTDMTRFNEIESNPELLEDFKRLMFIVRRSPNDMTKQIIEDGRSCLEHFITTCINIVEDKGFIHLPVRIQVLCNPEAGQEFVEQIDNCFNKKELVNG